ncbi:hypothetical protein SMICM17S_03079 [Streptomyces microflavus]
MDTLVGTAPTTVPTALRKLYLLRFAFAAVWAALLFATADTLGALTVVLLVIYPLFDVACAVVDLRSARARAQPVRGLYVNIALGTHRHRPRRRRHIRHPRSPAGLGRLGHHRRRRATPCRHHHSQLGGQWAMIASGAISTSSPAPVSSPRQARTALHSPTWPGTPSSAASSSSSPRSAWDAPVRRDASGTVAVARTRDGAGHPAKRGTTSPDS